MWTKKMSKCLGVITLLAVAGLSFAAGTPITPTNLDGVTLGSSVLDPAGKNMIPSNVGTFNAEVFHSSVYTYVFEITPGLDDAREVLSPINLEGFNGVAGWSFSQALAAGGPGDDTAWALTLTSNDWVRWDTPAQEGGSHFLDSSQPLKFFYQSTYGPTDAKGNYNLSVGLTAGFASGPIPVVPEPAALGLLLIGCSIAIRCKR